MNSMNKIVRKKFLAQTVYDDLGTARSILDDSEETLKELGLPEEDLGNLCEVQDILYGFQVFIENTHGVE